MGDRVVNLCSQERQYIEFGAPGTIIGTANDKVVVLFDQKFIAGENIY